MNTLSEASCTPPCKSRDAAFFRNMLYEHTHFIKTGGHPKEYFKRYGDVPGFSQGDYMMTELTDRTLPVKSRLKDRCEFWQQANVIQQYAWDEMSLARFQTVAV